MLLLVVRPYRPPFPPPPRPPASAPQPLLLFRVASHGRGLRARGGGRLKLTKHLVLPYGGGLPLSRLHLAMDRDNDPAAALLQLMPVAPMAYAVVVDLGAVDSPDVPSYQPHVYGRLDPPTLIPLQMQEVELHVDCAAVGCATAEVALRALVGALHHA